MQKEYYPCCSPLKKKIPSAEVSAKLPCLRVYFVQKVSFLIFFCYFFLGFFFFFFFNLLARNIGNNSYTRKGVSRGVTSNLIIQVHENFFVEYLNCYWLLFKLEKLS